MIHKKDKILFFKLQIIAANKGMKNGFYYTSIYCVQTLRFLGGGF